MIIFGKKNDEYRAITGFPLSSISKYHPWHFMNSEVPEDPEMHVNSLPISQDDLSRAVQHNLNIHILNIRNGKAMQNER